MSNVKAEAVKSDALRLRVVKSEQLEVANVRKSESCDS